MITRDQVLSTTLSPGVFPLLRRNAAKAEIGGHSNIRRGKERADNLSRDQLAGQIGAYASTIWLCGNNTPYKMARWILDQFPTSGDGGSDIPAANLDVKTSVMHGNRDLLDYRLLVRPKERHAGWVYILALVDESHILPLLDPNLKDVLSLPPITVHMMGWASDAMFPESPESSGIFEGAYVISARNLMPLPPFRWLW